MGSHELLLLDMRPYILCILIFSIIFFSRVLFSITPNAHPSTVRR
jgi:hypothetical protein